MPERCFGRSPGLWYDGPGVLRGAASLDPMNLRRIIPTEEASHFPKLILYFWELLRCSENFFRAALFIFQK